MAYMALSLLKEAMCRDYGTEKIEREVSKYHVADEISRVHVGMAGVFSGSHWEIFDKISTEEFADLLIEPAIKINSSKFKWNVNGPEKPPPKRLRGTKKTHVSTARMLKESKSK
jgi:hypothetical protein